MSTARALENRPPTCIFFYFDVPNAGESQLTAKAGDCTDESVIRKVDTFNEDYIMKETGDVINWFEIDMPEGYFSINDKLADIMDTEDGERFYDFLLGTDEGKIRGCGHG